MTTKKISEIYPKDRKTWRKWLEKNHDKEERIHVAILKKGSTKDGISRNEALDEALCFGWIDSTAYSVDDDHYLQLYARRKPSSTWSAINKKKVKELTAAGLMAEPGQKMIDLAKKTGTWDAQNDMENLVMPDDLKKAFAKKKTALKNWDAFPPSAKKVILAWITSAKQEATRASRIREAVEKAAINERANQYVPKPKTSK